HSLEVGLNEGLIQSYAMLVCLSKDYAGSNWCRAEIHDFIFQSILEGRIQKLPILILDLDGQVSNGEFLLMCFGKLALDKDMILLQRKFLDASIGFRNTLEYQIEAILEENNLEPDQIVNSLDRIPFSNPNIINPKIKQTIQKLVEIKNTWFEQEEFLRPTFSSIKDFYHIWDESLEHSAPNNSI
ncbi:hypothetical protein ACFLXY_10245, partial [Chloroflexota bacterium]